MASRPSPAFPSKFNPLPHITSPSPREENALVPVSASHDGSMDTDDKLRQMEVRLSVTEKSNRALLEEVVRLQGELKGSARRYDDMAREDRHARGQLEQALRGANDLISQMGLRLQRAEEKLQEERSTLAGLMNHTKSVEQTVIGGQHEILSRRDLQSTKINELRQDLDEMTRSKDTLEKVTYQLLDDIRMLKSRLDNQTSDFTAVALDLRNKTRKIEEEGRFTRLESLRKQGEVQNQSELTTQQLRQQTENRLTELRDVIIELRNSLEKEMTDRRSLEQQTHLKVSDLQAAITEQNRKREEALHAIELAQKERDHRSDAERVRLESKIADVVEELNKQMLQKEINLRQESQDKFSTLEQMLLSEQVQRQKQEQQMRQETEARWQAFKQLTGEELQGVREVIKNERKKNQDIFHRLNESIGLLEKQLDAMKKEHEKVIASEIKSRKFHQNETQIQIDTLNNKLQAAVSTLQQAVSGMQGKIDEETKKSKREIQAKVDDRRDADLRTMADMDARITGLTRRLAKAEDEIGIKLTELQQTNAAALRDKVDSITMWQDVTQQTLRELQSQLRDMPREIRNTEDRQRSLQVETDSRIRQEAESRIREIEDLKHEIEELQNRQQSGSANQKDLETCQQGIRKLAESIQTVKTVLGMKIQSEQQLRESTVESLQQQIDEVRQLLDGKPKPDNKDKGASGDEGTSEPQW